MVSLSSFGWKCSVPRVSEWSALVHGFFSAGKELSLNVQLPVQSACSLSPGTGVRSVSHTQDLLCYLYQKHLMLKCVTSGRWRHTCCDQAVMIGAGVRTSAESWGLNVCVSPLSCVWQDGGEHMHETDALI